MNRKQELKTQIQELKSHIQQPGFRHTLTSQQNDAQQKQNQLEENLSGHQDQDVAFKRNKKYREGSCNNQ